jgi:hypothetical protein
MTTEARILRDLKAGQSSLDSLVKRIGVSEKACMVVLKRLVAERKIVTYEIDCGITIYRIPR